MADSTGNVFNAVVQAVDKATAPLRGIAEHMKKVREAIEGAGKASEHAEHAHLRFFGALGGHIRILRGHFGEIHANLGELGHSVTEFLPMLGALGGAASLVGLFELTHQAFELNSALQNASVKAGLAVTQFNALQLGASTMEISTEQLQTSMFRLNRVIGDAAAGRNSARDAAALFKYLGISLRDAQGNVRNVGELLPQLSEAFHKTSSETMRSRMAMALFGREGMNLLPLLMKGREELEELNRTAAEVSFVPTGEDAEQLDKFEMSWASLHMAVNGFIMAVGARLAPVLRPIVTQFTEWVAANRDWVATAIAERVKELATWIGALHIGEIIKTMKEWIGTLRAIGGHVGGVVLVISALTLALGSPLLLAVSSIMSIMTGLGRVLIWLTGIMWANPILAAIGAVAVAAFLIYQNWGWVKEQMAKVFNWFASQSGWVQGLLAAIAPIIFVPMLIIEHWSTISAFFNKVWAEVVATFNAVMAPILPVIQALLHPVDTLIAHWQQIVGFFRGLWDDVTGIFRAAWSHISPIVNSIVGAVHAFQGSWVGRHLGLNLPSAAARSQDLEAGAGGPVDAGPGGAAGPGNPYAPGSPAAGSIVQNGRVSVDVNFRNAPAGTAVQTQSRGAVAEPETSVGYAAPAFAY